MASRALRKVADHLRRIALLGEARNMSDAELLEWYLQGRDEAAFRAIVKRHGPMVLGVCERVLRHTQDAEDAFQATFMVLVHNAAKLKCPQLLGNWLYGVAYRTALHAKATISKRRAKEQQMINRVTCEEAQDQTLLDLRPILDRELERLPEKYRTAIVLCDLESRPRSVVACQLGIPEGTLSSRLAAGRKILAKRLTRRGLTVSAAALTVNLVKTASAAAIVPPSLLMATAKAASLFAAASNAAEVLSASVGPLTTEALNTLRWAKLKMVAGLAVLGGVLALAIGAGLAGRGSDRPSAENGLAAPIRSAGKGAGQSLRAPEVPPVAAAPMVVDLWPGNAPGETRSFGKEKLVKVKKWDTLQVQNVSKPTLTIYRPAEEIDTGTALIVAPGGNFSFLTWDEEGENIAKWCSSIGVTGIVLKYRVPRRPDNSLAPFQDGQRAVSFVRSKSADWGIDPNRIGMIGFSAGGTVTQHVIVNIAQRSYDLVDDIDLASTRLNFAALIYSSEGFGSRRSKYDLTAINKDMLPPIFLCAGFDDSTQGGAASTAQSFIALKNAGVQAELHIYATGSNGFGIRPRNSPLVADSTNRQAAWMSYHKLLEGRD